MRERIAGQLAVKCLSNAKERAFTGCIFITCCSAFRETSAGKSVIGQTSSESLARDNVFCRFATPLACVIIRQGKIVIKNTIAMSTASSRNRSKGSVSSASAFGNGSAFDKDILFAPLTTCVWMTFTIL